MTGAGRGFAVIWSAACAAVLAGVWSCPLQASGRSASLMDLEVDARDTRHRIIVVHESFSISGGGRDFAVQYPRWIPGDHAPSGTVQRLGGLVVRVDGVVVQWIRDPADDFTFRVPVNAASRRVELQFEYLASHEPGDALMTRGIVAIKWPLLVLYPKGSALTDIKVRPRVLLPDGWRWQSSLATAASAKANTVEIAPLDLGRLVDSPLYAAQEVQSVDLSLRSGPTVTLSVFGERGANVAPSVEQINELRALMRETQRLFGSAPFDIYHFLVTLDPAFGETGLEHLTCSEVALSPNHFADWANSWNSRYLLAHELVHAWNGKARTPRGLMARDLNSPLRTDMLWVYEGLTQYWAKVLTVRAGLWSADQGLQDLAVNIAQELRRPTRTWRPLADSTFDPIINARDELTWRSRSGYQDYYDAGALFWLDVDLRLHQTGHSLDDFARAFFAPGLGAGFERRDVIAALDHLSHADWAVVLHHHLDEAGTPDLRRMAAEAGYQLVFDELPGRRCTAPDERRGLDCYGDSLGLTVGEGGVVESVEWNGPAFRAGMGPGMKLLAVDHAAFTRDQLIRNISNAGDSSADIVLTVQDEGAVEEVSIPYHDGMRYPHLQPIAGAKHVLDTIFAAQAR